MSSEQEAAATSDPIDQIKGLLDQVDKALGDVRRLADIIKEQVVDQHGEVGAGRASAA